MYEIYIVRLGDTLAGIASVNNIEIDELIKNREIGKKENKKELYNTMKGE